MEENEGKKRIGFAGILVRVLAVLGLIFLILMLIPDDETDEQEEAGIETESERDTEDSDNSASASGTGKDGDTADADPKSSSAKRREDKRESEGCAAPVSTETDARSATIMIYMNGSDLETKQAAATTDIAEMLGSGIGDRVKVVIQTMGTKKWHDYGISAKKSQTWEVSDGELKLIRDDLGQLDCTDPDTLSEFIGFCASEYPADRYMFIFWDHGGGPVFGFGYDEWQSEEESLTIAEMSKAFSENSDIHFDIIGMDCCIMANLETCYALAPYCRYALLSEDFESGLGWSYSDWMKYFEEDPSLSTPLLGKYIVDSIIKDNDESPDGGSSCLSLFNESNIERLFSAWKTYAFLNGDSIMGKNYSRMHKSKGRFSFFESWLSDGSNVTLSDYYITDILALVESVDNKSDSAKELISALKASVAYFGHTSDKNELTGMAVSLPYGDPDFYDQQKDVYTQLGLEKDYVRWLSGFTTAEGSEDYHDYSDFEDSWGGWGQYEEDYGCGFFGAIHSLLSDDEKEDDESSSGGLCLAAGQCEETDDWTYDCEEEIWYLYEDDILYLYDDETDTTFYYDEEDDCLYYLDEDEEWQLAE